MITLASEIHTGLRRTDEQFEDAFARGDAAAVAELYTDDAMLLPAGSDFVKGRDAIRQYWQSAMDKGISSVRLTILEIEDNAETAVTTGEYTLASREGETQDNGKYMVVWKQQGHDWKMYRDIWTTSVSQ
ncbi:MAG TPA: SgcJ/EcaC family oxidoreductase [Sphingobacteriaceae bacterium]